MTAQVSQCIRPIWYQSRETSGPPLMSIVAGPAGIIVDEGGFVYVSNFAGVDIL